MQNQNQYELIANIGEGAYGIVMKCKNKETGEFVAIKRFKDAEDEIVQKSMLREIKVLRSVKHPNIVQLKECFKRKGQLYLVFEYVEKTLLEIIEANPNGLDQNLIKNYIYQLCKAVYYIHSLNIVHRDVKPENILINNDNVLKLCDFGFARALPQKGGLLTDYVATRWYRAPELLLGTTNYGKEVDSWAIGCIMGEITDGQPMFPGDNELNQLILIQKLLGNFTQNQIDIFVSNPRFADHKLETIAKPETLERRYYGKLSKQGFAFMKSLLKLEPKERLSGLDVIMHSYFDDIRAEDPEFNHLNCKVSNNSSEGVYSSRLISNGMLNKKNSNQKIDSKFLLNSNTNNNNKSNLYNNNSLVNNTNLNTINANGSSNNFNKTNFFQETTKIKDNQSKSPKRENLNVNPTQKKKKPNKKNSQNNINIVQQPNNGNNININVMQSTNNIINYKTFYNFNKKEDIYNYDIESTQDAVSNINIQEKGTNNNIAPKNTTQTQFNFKKVNKQNNLNSNLLVIEEENHDYKNCEETTNKYKQSIQNPTFQKTMYNDNKLKFKSDTGADYGEEENSPKNIFVNKKNCDENRFTSNQWNPQQNSNINNNLNFLPQINIRSNFEQHYDNSFGFQKKPTNKFYIP